MKNTKQSNGFFLRVALSASCFIGLLSCARTTENVEPVATPQPQSEKTTELGVGTASFYGPDFHGKKTASGETFNQNDITCAHRTLPFGTRLKVTNLENGKSVICTVNDRGPHVKGRLVDVSKGAASELAFLHDGTGKVRIERVDS